MIVGIYFLIAIAVYAIAFGITLEKWQKTF